MDERRCSLLPLSRVFEVGDSNALFAIFPTLAKSLVQSGGDAKAVDLDEGFGDCVSLDSAGSSPCKQHFSKEFEHDLPSAEDLCRKYRIEYELLSRSRSPFLSPTRADVQNSEAYEREFLRPIGLMVGIELELQIYSQQALVRALLYSLFGICCHPFYYDRDRNRFELTQFSTFVGTAPETVQQLVEPFLSCGPRFTYLQKLVQPSFAHSLVVRSFKTALRCVLRSYASALQSAFENATSFHGFVLEISRSTKGLSAIYSFCDAHFFEQTKWKADSKPVKAMYLLNELYVTLSQPLPSEVKSTLSYMFSAALEPFLSMLLAFVETGKFEDPYSEFFIKVDDVALSRRDNGFWEDGYRIDPDILGRASSTTIGMFFIKASTLSTILDCGRIVNLVFSFSCKQSLAASEHCDVIPSATIQSSVAVESSDGEAPSLLDDVLNLLHKRQQKTESNSTADDASINGYHELQIPSTSAKIVPINVQFSERSAMAPLLTLDTEKMQQIFQALVQDAHGHHRVSSQIFEHFSSFPDDLIVFPFEQFLMQKLTPRFDAATKMGVRYFLDELKFVDQLHYLRSILLFADGTFGYVLSEDLFALTFFDEGNRGVVEKNTKGKLPPLLSRLTPILDRALRISDLPQSAAARFSFRLLNDNKNANSENAEIQKAAAGDDLTERLAIHYQVPWPLSLVIAEHCLTSYNAVFGLFLSLHRLLWALKESYLWLRLKNETLSAVLQTRLLYVRHSMQHFVQALQGYFAHQIIDVAWQELQAELAQASCFADLKKTHDEYLHKLLWQGLLNVDMQNVMNYLKKVLDLVLKFCHLFFQIKNCDASQINCDSYLKSLSDITGSFKRHVMHMCQVIRTLVENNGFFGLEDLLNRINFNDVYLKPAVVNHR